MVLVQRGQMKTGGQQAADLRLQTVAEFQRIALVDLRAAFDAQLICTITEFPIRQPVTHHQFTGALRFVVIEQKKRRIHETREQRTARPQHARAFAPDRREIWNEYVRHRMEDQVETPVGKHR
jgi:hypothetical protein